MTTRSTAAPRRTSAGRGPKHAPKVPFALLVVGLVVGGMCLLLALNTASAANELSRHDLASKDAAVAASLEQLRIDVAASAAPANLARVAGQLGMVPAGHPAFLEIGGGGAVTLLGSPAPVAGAPQAPAAPVAPATSAAAPTSTAAPAPGNPAPATGTPTPTPTLTPTTTPTPITTLPGGTR
jgi:hypothetical protein